MARLFLIVAVFLVALTVFSVVDCLTTDRRGVRALPKAVWVLVLLVLPAIGPLLWFTIGRGSAPRPVGPDDDPAFLARTGATGRTVFRPRSAVRPSDAEEIRRLEEELARSDSDDGDDPGRP